ncbi:MULTISPECIES: flagellar hook-length control protein FliK [Sphingomonas]|jgi:flagellar hook-length control protein FliK
MQIVGSGMAGLPGAIGRPNGVAQDFAATLGDLVSLSVPAAATASPVLPLSTATSDTGAMAFTTLALLGSASATTLTTAQAAATPNPPAPSLIGALGTAPTVSEGVTAPFGTVASPATVPARPSNTPSVGDLVLKPSSAGLAITAPSAPKIATDLAPTLLAAPLVSTDGSLVAAPLPTRQGAPGTTAAAPARELGNAVASNATATNVATTPAVAATTDTPAAAAPDAPAANAAPVPPAGVVAASPLIQAAAPRAVPVATTFASPIDDANRETVLPPSTVLAGGKADAAGTTVTPASAPAPGPTTTPTATAPIPLPPQSMPAQAMAVAPVDAAMPAAPENAASAAPARPGKAKSSAANDGTLDPAMPMAVAPVALAATTVPVMPVATVATATPAVSASVTDPPAAPVAPPGTLVPDSRQPIEAPNALPAPPAAASSALPDGSPRLSAPESRIESASPASPPSPVGQGTPLPTAQNPIADAPPSASPAGPAVPVAKTAPDAIAATVLPAESPATPAARPAVRARRDHADAEVETPDQSSPAMAAVTPPPTPTDATGGIPATAQPSPPPQTAAQDTTLAAPASAPAPREVSVSAILPPADTGLSTPHPSLASNPAPTLPTSGLPTPADAPQNPRGTDLPPGQPAGTAAAAMVAPTAVGARAPIATAAPRTLISAQPGRIGRETGVAIAHRIGTGGDEMTLHLSPASLGRIEVKIAFEDGSLRATLRADNPAALDLLRRDSTDLSRALDQAGVRSDSASLSFQGRGADGQPAGSRQQSPFAAFAQRGQQADSPTTPIPDSYQPLRTSSRVDFLA